MTPTSDFNPEEAIRSLLLHVGEDPTREGLVETPARYLKAMQFWTSGNNQDPKEVLKLFDDGAEHYDEMVFQRNIPVWSLCEHHIAPFFGVVHIGYLPKTKIVGLSKLSRLVDVFARRLQVQERLTSQIANALMEHLGASGVGVVMECRHTCMESRGVQKAGSVTVTSAMLGAMRNEPETRAEFLSFVQAK